MSIQQKINDDLREAMKGGDSLQLGTLRLLSSAIHNREIEKKTKKGESVLTEEEVLEVLTKEAKKRKEAAEVYSRGGREDLSKKEMNELALIKRYLPEEVGEAEIEKVVEAVISRLGASSASDFGRVMGEVIKELKGRADAGAISGIVKQKLQ